MEQALAHTAAPRTTVLTPARSRCRLLSRRVRISYARLTPRPIPRDRAQTYIRKCEARDLERKKFSQASGAADALDKANKEIATLKERIREFKELVKGCTEIVRLRRAKSGGLTTEQFTFSKRSRDGTVINEDGEAEAGRGGAGVSAAASDGMGMPVDEGTPVDEGLEKDEESEGEEALKEQLRSAHEQIAMLKAMVAKLEAEKEELAIAAALASYVSDAIELPNADEVAAGFDSVTSDNAQSAAVASDSESPSPELARVRAEAEGGQFVNGEVIHPASGALTRGEHAASREQQQQTPHVQQQQTQQQAGSQALQSAATVEEPLTGINPETGAYYSRVLSSVEESEALANLAAFFTDRMKEENRREKNGHSCVVVDKKLLYPISGEYDKTLEPIDKEAQEMSTVCIDSQSIRHCMGRVPGLKTVVNACVKEASRTTGVKLKEYDAHVLLQGVELNNASVWDKHRDVQDGEKAAEAWKKKQDYEPSSEQEEYQQLKASTLHTTIVLLLNDTGLPGSSMQITGYKEPIRYGCHKGGISIFPSHCEHKSLPAEEGTGTVLKLSIFCRAADGSLNADAPPLAEEPPAPRELRDRNEMAERKKKDAAAAASNSNAENQLVNPRRKKKAKEKAERGSDVPLIDLIVKRVPDDELARLRTCAANGATSKGRALPARKTPLPADLSEALRSGELVALRCLPNTKGTGAATVDFTSLRTLTHIKSTEWTDEFNDGDFYEWVFQGGSRYLLSKRAYDALTETAKQVCVRIVHSRSITCDCCLLQPTLMPPPVL